jgi:SAM-dependent methyltransferase
MDERASEPALPAMPAVFDDHAVGYDDVAGSALGLALRAHVHHVLAGVVGSGDTVVDLGCGTGIDAEWLAPRVARVLGFDVSPVMVDTARRRCRGLANVTIDVADAQQITLAEPVDVVLAGFGVVNCVDLDRFGSRLDAIVRPGGHAVVVTMTRWCPIELAIGMLTANGSLLRRRSRHRGIAGPGAGSTPGAAPGYGGLRLRYASAGDLASVWAAGFELVHAESLGIALPPLEQRSWVEGRPRLLAALAVADRRLGRAGGRLGVGDHHIAVLRRRNGSRGRWRCDA